MPHIVRVAATYRNTRDRTVTLIRQQDASMWGWDPPHDWFVIRDDAGGIVPPDLRCGNHGSTYDESTLVPVAPGSTFDETFILPCTLSAGTYRVRLHYILHERPAGGLPASAEHLAIGRITSNEIAVDIPGPRVDEWMRGPASAALAKLVAALANPDLEYFDQREVVDALRRLSSQDALAPSDRDRLRAAILTFVKRHEIDEHRKLNEALGIAMSTLVDVADESCAPIFERWARHGSEHSRELDCGVRGLVKLRGREVATDLVDRLAQADGEAILPLVCALAIVHPIEDIDAAKVVQRPDGGKTIIPMQTVEDYRACKARWLAWWRDEGEAWVRAGARR